MIMIMGWIIIRADVGGSSIAPWVMSVVGHSLLGAFACPATPPHQKAKASLRHSVNSVTS